MKQFDEIEKLLAGTRAPSVVEGSHKVRLKRELVHRMQKEGSPMRAWKRNVAVASAALMLVVAATVVFDWFGTRTGSPLSALDVLGQAAYAMENIRSVHITARMRTVAHDNFELIGVDYDFVPHDMWKQFGDPPQWRVEKPRRLAVMNGQSSLLLIEPFFGRRPYASQGDIRRARGYVGWLNHLLDADVNRLLDYEMRLAEEQGSELVLKYETGADGAPKLVVEIEAAAQGDYTASDYSRNSSVSESDNLRVYQFDAETKLLEGLRVYVHTDQEDVLVFEITGIEYNVDIDPALFAVEVPDDVIWFTEPEELGEEYRQMGPKEVARAFFQAMADEDWDELLKFWPQSDIDQRSKEHLGGLEIISIGEPFKSGRYPGWFVPYEIKFKSGYVKKMNLAVRNDNAAQRYVMDGGF